MKYKFLFQNTDNIRYILNIFFLCNLQFSVYWMMIKTTMASAFCICVFNKYEFQEKQNLLVMTWQTVLVKEWLHIWKVSFCLKKFQTIKIVPSSLTFKNSMKSKANWNSVRLKNKIVMTTGKKSEWKFISYGKNMKSFEIL